MKTANEWIMNEWMDLLYLRRRKMVICQSRLITQKLFSHKMWQEMPHKLCGRKATDSGLQCKGDHIPITVTWQGNFAEKIWSSYTHRTKAGLMLNLSFALAFFLESRNGQGRWFQSGWGHWCKGKKISQVCVNSDRSPIIGNGAFSHVSEVCSQSSCKA